MLRHLIVVLTSCLVVACDASKPAHETPVSVETSALTGSITFRRGLSNVADATLSERAQRTNFGAQKVLRVTPKKEALLRFDLSAIPSAAVITSARLTVFINGEDEDEDDCDRHDRRDAPVTLHRVTRGWSEASVTYDNFDQRFDPAVAASLRVSSQSAFKTVDVRSLVAAWVSGAQPNHGMLLKTEGRTRVVIVSSEQKAVSQRPTLEVVYTVPDDHCASAPCLNGGTCTNGTSGFTCDCAPGYEGSTCADPIDRCAPNPCANGGVCTSSGTGFSCACEAGWAGVTCETNRDECMPNPCRNGGTCTDGLDDYTCACLPGFSGDDCEVDIDDCAAAPCQNGATCVDQVAGYQCLCVDGFTGAHCDKNIDDCVANGCQNGATCIDGVNGYTCSCAPGFDGPLCGNDIDDCAGSPCLNGGTCDDGLVGYTCTCAAGYTGAQCQIDIDDCAAQPCVHGQCLDGVAGYQCTCNGFWVGTHCDACPTGYEPRGDECVPSDPCTTPGGCGCGGSDADSDGDGVADCRDGCPQDPAKTDAGACGCGLADVDADQSGSPDCLDACTAEFVPVYQYWQGQVADHFYTTDLSVIGVSTVGSVGNFGYVLEGIAFQVHPRETPGTVPLYRYWSGALSNHFYTVDQSEVGAGYVYQGIAGWVHASPVPGTVPLLRYYNPAVTDHFYTTDLGEIGVSTVGAVGNFGYLFEGIAAYVHPADAISPDGCPLDPAKTTPGACGCGVADTDSDSDGAPDCNDACAADPAKLAPGTCGCGVADTDTDADGVADCNDPCASDPAKTSAGVCGCGVADTDADGNGTPDCLDGPATTLVPLYRYYQPSIIDHFYTTDLAEIGVSTVGAVGNYGYVYQGIALRLYTQQVPGTVPLHQYWNPATTDHFYTTDLGELGTNGFGYTYERVVGYIYPTQVTGTVPLFRYWSAVGTDHFYTTDWSLLGSGARGYVFEWIAGYVFPP